MDGTDGSDPIVQRQLDGELRLVREAILMVSAKGAPAVLVAGLGLGEAVLDATRRLALESGVRVLPMWTADERHVDIRVEALRP